MTAWPKRGSVRAFFGEPGSRDATAGTCNLAYPMRIAWDKKQIIRQFRCHTKVEVAFEKVFQNTLAHYGLPEIQRLGLDLFGGCYNFRPMRGSSQWSMHAFGIAVDLDPERNQLKWGRDKAQFAKPEYKPFWDIVAEQGLWSLGMRENRDFMHFEATCGR